MIEIIAPDNRETTSQTKLFLAGSIEQGKATDWQDYVATKLSDIENLTIYNPRRKEWDSSWVQSIDNPEFREQVRWEHSRIYRSNAILFYFEPGTYSPITLQEFGIALMSSYKDMYVVCPKGYWRRGNIEVSLEYYNKIPLYENLDDGILAFRKSYARLGGGLWDHYGTGLRIRE